MNIKNKQAIYNKWHKKIYQIDLECSRKRQKDCNTAIINYLGITSDSKGKFLDIACGKGNLLRELREKNQKLKLYGSDISDYAISLARKVAKDVVFSVDDGEKLSFKSNQFDYTSCIGGLEYYTDPVKGAKEIARVLTKNGMVLIGVPNLMFVGFIWLALRYGIMPTHGGTSNRGTTAYDYNSEKFYTYEGWKNVLKKGGLRIIACYRYDPVGYTRFMNRFLVMLYDKFLHRFVPFNLTVSFMFLCKKDEK